MNDIGWKHATIDERAGLLEDMILFAISQRGGGYDVDWKTFTSDFSCVASDSEFANLLGVIDAFAERWSMLDPRPNLSGKVRYLCEIVFAPSILMVTLATIKFFNFRRNLWLD